jgi:hypothetical protein
MLGAPEVLLWFVRERQKQFYKEADHDRLVYEACGSRPHNSLYCRLMRSLAYSLMKWGDWLLAHFEEPEDEQPVQSQQRRKMA